MKVIFLLTQDLDSPSGLGRFGPLARELARRKHQVTIYALHPDFENLTRRRWSEGNLNVEYVSPMHVRKSGSQKTYYSMPVLLWTVLRATFALLRAALLERADIVYIGKPHPMNGLAGVAAKARWKSRLILDCDDDEAGSGRFKYGWQRWVVAAFEQALPRQADRVIVNTMHTFHNMMGQGIPETKITYLPNGVERDRFSREIPEETIRQMKAELNLTGVPVISYIGSMSKSNHAVDLLIDAFALLRRRGSPARLLLVGGGEDLETFRSQVAALGLQQSAVFTGRVPPENTPTYYRLSDVTVDPIYEDLAAMGRSPLKMFEAWASGVPFVSAVVGDRPMIVGNPPAALLVQPGDAQSLADGINDLLTAPERRREFSRLGSERLREYTWDQLVDRVSHLFCE